MGKLTVAEFLSLDGVMAAPTWTFPYWHTAIAHFKYAELVAGAALLLGRKTYEGFAQAWPARAGVDDYANRMNQLPKHVVSSTLRHAPWQNSTIINGDVAAAIQHLKAQPGGNLLVFGSGTLVTYLTAQRLVDEYRLLVYPVVLGKGQRLFGEGNNLRLKLIESHPFASGVTALIYQPM